MQGGYSCSSGPEPTTKYIRFGRADVSSGSAYVSFDGYTGSETPLLFVMPPISKTNIASQKAESVRVDGVSTTGATLRTWRPDRSGGSNINTVDYLVIEPGVHRLGDRNGQVRVTIEATSFKTCDWVGKRSNDWRGCPDNPRLAYRNFSHDFTGTPAVLGELQTHNSHNYSNRWAPFYTVNIQDVSQAGANFSLEGSEVQNYFLNWGAVGVESETLGYLAVEGEGEVYLNGQYRRVESGSNLYSHSASSSSFAVTANHQQQCVTSNDLAFSQNFPSVPYLFADKNTRNGADGGWARVCTVTEDQVNVIVDEDTTLDSERSHYRERFGYLAIEGPQDQPAATMRLRHPDTAISCAGAEVVVDVCSNSNCTAFDTSNTYSLALTATGSVTWQNLRTGDTGSTLQVQHNDRLRLWQSDAINNVDVTIGVSSHASQCLSGDGDSDCLITFTPSGLLLSTGQNYQTSCKTGDNLQVSVVETSTQDPQQCLPATAGDEPVAFTFQYANPSSGLSVSEPLMIDGVSLNSGEALTRQMNFETDGIDQLPIQYNEAGRLKVSATMLRGTGSGQVTLTGEADVDWLPAGLHISAGDSLCTAGDENCSPLMKAGNSVDVNVTAHCWVANDDGNFGNNPRTRNFRHSGIDLEPELVAPSGGQNSADLPADASGNAVIGNDGSGTVARVLDEVGVFRFVPKDDIDYLGHQLAKSSASSANIGRVTPAYLGAETANTALGAYCNSFSYLGQPVPYTSMPVVTVTGYATDGSVTNNFDSAFWNLPNPMGSRAYGTQNASVSVQEPSGIAVTEADANDLDGSRRFSVNKNWISFARPTAPVAPLGTTASGSQTTLSLPVAAFTVSGDQLCLGQWGSCQSAAFTTQSGGASLGYIQGPQLRYGRAVLASAYGSENQVVRMPLTLEYFNGLQFATNLLDTGFYGDGRALNTGSPATSGRVTLTGSLSPLPVTSGQAYSLSGVFGSLSIAGAGAVTNPPLTLEYHLEHPFASQTGCTFPEAASMAPTWLQWYWDKDNPSVLHNPSAEVTLGRYRGHDKVIYRREVF